MNDKKFTVYKHTNVKNRKIYIGITSKNPEERWQNGNGYRPQKLFWRAIQKYGWINFKSEILFSNITKKEACSKEIKLIKKYKSNNREFGYNISSGGESGSYGIKWSEESKRKQSESHKNFRHTEESKLKIGLNSWTKKNKGNIIFSEEHKQKMRYAKRNISKKVICLETNEIFDSLCEASRKLNISKSSISRVCLKERKTAGKLHFKFYVDGDKI